MGGRGSSVVDVVPLATLLPPLLPSSSSPLHPGQGRGVTALAQMCRLHLLPPIFLPLKTETGGGGGKVNIGACGNKKKNSDARKTKQKRKVVIVKDFTPVLGR